MMRPYPYLPADVVALLRWSFFNSNWWRWWREYLPAGFAVFAGCDHNWGHYGRLNLMQDLLLPIGLGCRTSHNRSSCYRLLAGGLGYPHFEGRVESILLLARGFIPLGCWLLKRGGLLLNVH